MEGKILGAEERSVKLEYELFQRVREEVPGAVAENSADRGGAGAIGRAELRLPRPRGCIIIAAAQIGDEGVLQIRDGRHPVLEQSSARRDVSCRMMLARERCR
jgi:DNA mismatch repair protein MutS